MIEELSEDYIPDEVLHREEQIEKIKDIFQNFLDNKIGTNIIIFGVTGSGKTLLVKKVMKEMNNAIYVSCDNTLTAFKTLKTLFNLNSKTHQEILETAIKELKKNPKILIFDEIDKISRSEDFTKLMSNFNTIYRKTMVPIILITLKRDILNNMKTDVRKTLLFEKLNLPSYNAKELKDILKQRISKIKLDVDEGIINYISALAAQYGSARLLMNLLLRCIQKNDFSFDFIDGAFKQIIKEDWIDFINDINPTEREFLRTLLYLCNDEKEVSAEELEKKLNITRQRIYQLINTFENYSVIISRHENLGRAGGRKRFVKFASKEAYDEINKFMGYE